MSRLEVERGVYERFASAKSDVELLEFAAFAAAYGGLGVEKRSESATREAWRKEQRTMRAVLGRVGGVMLVRKVRGSAQSNPQRAGILAALKRKTDVDDADLAAALNRQLARWVRYEISADLASVDAVPTGLLGEMWLQIAERLSAGSPEKECICGKWFAPKRPKAIYCSTACRVRAHRAEKDRVANGTMGRIIESPDAPPPSKRR